MRTDHLPFARHAVIATTKPDTDARKELATLDRVAAVFRSHPNYAAPDTFVLAMKNLLKSKRFRLLSENEPLK